MNLEETSKVLGKLALYDNRKVGQADVLAWHEVLGRLDLRDCLEAVTVHYSESSQRAMPADIRKLAIVIRDQRKSREAKFALPAPPPARSAAVTALVREVAARLPRPVPQDRAEDIQARAVVMARRLRGRPEPAHRAVRVPKGPTGQTTAMPPKDLETGSCQCGAVYLLDGEGRASHRTVFGHNPMPKVKESAR